MAYDPKVPPSLLANGIGGAKGLRQFTYRSTTDSVATVLGAGYIKNARKIGMREGDALRFVDPNDDTHYLQVGPISDAGAATLEFPGVAIEALPEIGYPDVPGTFFVGYDGGKQARFAGETVAAQFLEFSKASQAEAEEGVLNDKGMTPLRTTQLFYSKINYLMPEEASAVGDGVVDDFAAVQEAFASGERVYLSRSYLVSDTVMVSSGLRVFGPGKLIGAPTKVLVGISGVENVTIEGIELTQNAAIAEYDSSTWKMCIGTDYLGTTASERISLLGLRVHNTGRHGILNGKGGNYWTVDNCDIWQTARDGAHMLGGKGHKLTHNRLRQTGDDGLVLSGSNSDGVISDNVIFDAGTYNFGGSGIRTNGDCVVIANNVITGFDLFGIVVASLDDNAAFRPDLVTVEGNVISGAKPRSNPICSGIAIRNADRVKLSGNQIDPRKNAEYTVSNAVDNGSGLVRLTLSSGPNTATGTRWRIEGVGGVTGANGVFTVTVISANVLDLQGSTFTGAYTSGGVCFPAINAVRVYAKTDVPAQTAQTVKVTAEANDIYNVEDVYFLTDQGLDKLIVKDDTWETYQNGVSFGVFTTNTSQVEVSGVVSKGARGAAYVRAPSSGAAVLARLAVKNSNAENAPATAIQFNGRSVTRAEIEGNGFAGATAFSSDSAVAALLFDGDHSLQIAKSGTGTIVIGATSVTIAHGLPWTPRREEITVTPNSQALAVRIQSITATDIVFTVATAVATTDFTFAYKIRFGPRFSVNGTIS